MSYNTNPYPLADLAEKIGENAIAHGFRHPGVYRDIVLHTALLHSEVSEMFEAWREGDQATIYEGEFDGLVVEKLTFDLKFDESGKPVGVVSEIADVIIRALDFCHEYGIAIDEAVRDKMAFNESRPHRHGGKLV